MLSRKINTLNYCGLFNIRRYVSDKLTCEALKAFQMLGISKFSTPEECKRAYLKLACSIHPDKRKDSEANAEFQQLHEAYTIAYEVCVHNQKANILSTLNQLEDDILDFRHKAPQHRRFLDLGRQEQQVDGENLSEHRRSVQSQRIARAMESAADYRIKKIMEFVSYDDVTDQKNCSKLLLKGRRVHNRNADISKATSTDYFTRVAEEHIQSAIERGEFNHLPGQGRPLDYDNNSHVIGDSTAKRLNQLLANQGFLPKWVLLNKEVSSRWNNALAKLKSIYKTQSNLTSAAWLQACKEFETEVEELNRLLDQYNLIVPSHHMQRLHFNTKTVIEQLMESKGPQETKAQNNSFDTNVINDENKSGALQTDDKKSLWDPRYMAEVMSDFYRELVKAYISIMRGFKDHK